MRIRNIYACSDFTQDDELILVVSGEVETAASNLLPILVELDEAEQQTGVLCLELIIQPVDDVETNYADFRPVRFEKVLPKSSFGYISVQHDGDEVANFGVPPANSLISGVNSLSRNPGI